MVLLRWSVGAVGAGSVPGGAVGGARFGVMLGRGARTKSGLRRQGQGSRSREEGRWGWQEAGWASGAGRRRAWRRRVQRRRAGRINICNLASMIYCYLMRAYFLDESMPAPLKLLSDLC